MDAEIENLVRKCGHCQMHSESPPSAASHPWEFPSQPWSRLHLDYAGPFQGHMFLVVVDSFSKWLEVAVVSAATSRNTIDKLREMFARHGIPETMVTDNGTPFTSFEFQTFVDRNGIQHCRSAPYHSASNGLVERAVHTLKRGLMAQHTGDIPVPVQNDSSLGDRCCSFRITDEEEAENTSGHGKARHCPESES